MNPESVMYPVLSPVTQYSTFEFEVRSVTHPIIAEFDVILPAVTLLITGAGTAVVGAVVLVEEPPTVIVAIFDSLTQLVALKQGFT